MTDMSIQWDTKTLLIGDELFTFDEDGHIVVPEPKPEQYQVGDWVAGGILTGPVKIEHCYSGYFVSNGVHYRWDEVEHLATIDDFAFEVEGTKTVLFEAEEMAYPVIIMAQITPHGRDIKCNYAAESAIGTVLRELARLNNKPICPPSVHKGNYRLGGTE